MPEEINKQPDNDLLLIAADGLADGAKFVNDLLKQKLSPEEWQLLLHKKLVLIVARDGVNIEEMPEVQTFKNRMTEALDYLTIRESDIKQHQNETGKNVSSLKFAAFWIALGDGSITENTWQTVIAELARQGVESSVIESYSKRKLTAAAILGDAEEFFKGVELENLAQKFPQFPKTVEVYQAYMRFIASQIADMHREQVAQKTTWEIQKDRILQNGIDGIKFKIEGNISAENVVTFYNIIVKKWPKDERKLLGQRGTVFVLGDQFSDELSLRNRNEVCIGKDLAAMSSATKSDNLKAVRRNVKFGTFIAILGKGPESIYWDAAIRSNKQSMATGALKTNADIMKVYDVDIRPYAAVLVSAARLINFKLDGTFKADPVVEDPIIDAYKQYLSFVSNQVAEIKKDDKSSVNGDQGQWGITLSPEEIARRAAENARLKEADLLPHLKYGLTEPLKVLRNRATTGKNGRKELAAGAWGEIEPLTEKLNRNFAPQLRLGDLLFLEDNAHTLGVVNFLSLEGSVLNINTAIRIPLRDQFISVLSGKTQNLAPEMQTSGMRDRFVEANDANHQQVQKDLLNAQLLTIAAIGTKNMIDEARALQELLFPKDPKHKPNDQAALELLNELKAIANNAIKNAFTEAGKPIPDYILAMINPPEPAAPAQEISTTAIVIPPKLSDVLQEAESFIRRTQQLDESDPPNPYNMFRARLGMEAGYPITLSLSRWVDEGGRRYADTQEQILTPDFVSLREALNIKQLLQTHVLNMPDIVGHRKLHNGVYTITENDPLPDALPTNRSRDNELGELRKSDGLMALKLVFSDPSSSGRNSPRTVASIQLGIEQSGNKEMANERRLLVIDYLKDLRQRNQEFIDLDQRENVRRVTGQDVSLWLGQRIGDLQYLSAIADSITPEDHNQRIRSFAEELRKPISEEVSPRDWLNQQIARIGDRWEKARTIELGDDFPREIRINLPYSNSDNPEQRTKLVIHDPMLSGTPVPFYSSQISIYRDNQKIAAKNLNLHMSAADESGEPGTIPDIVINRLRVAATLLEEVLSNYTETYPEADWHISRSGRLRQYTAGQLQETSNLDWTRLDTLIAATLPHTGVMTVANIIPENGLEPNNKNKIRFNLSFYRQDGSQFLEQSRSQSEPSPVIREFTMTVAPLGTEEIDTAIEKFKEQKITALKEEIRAEILRASPEIESEMLQQAMDLTVKRLIAETSLSREEESQAIKEFSEKRIRASIRVFEQNVQSSFTGLLEDAYSPFPKSRDDVAPALPAIEQIISMVRFGPAPRDASVSEPRTTTDPINPYHPRTVTSFFNEAITNAKKEVGNQLGIEQLPGQSPQGRGNNTTRRPGDPRNHHTPTGGQPNPALGSLRKQQQQERLPGDQGLI